MGVKLPPVRCCFHGCSRKEKSRGLCQYHYDRGRRRGWLKPIQWPKVCYVEGCDRKPVSKGLCRLHQRRIEKTGEPGPAGRIHQPRDGVCIVEGCDRKVQAKQRCSKHYEEWRACGRMDPKDAPRCSVSWCLRPALKTGLCSRHNQAEKRYGHALGASRHEGPPFFFVDREGHWRWIGAKSKFGHGLARVGSLTTTAHRLVWDQLVFAIPRGMDFEKHDFVLDHVCSDGTQRNRDCVNPYHLELVDQNENIRRALWAARSPHWFAIWQRTKLQRLAVEYGEIEIPEGWSVSEEEAREILKHRRKIKSKKRRPQQLDMF